MKYVMSVRRNASRRTRAGRPPGKARVGALAGIFSLAVLALGVVFVARVYATLWAPAPPQSSSCGSTFTSFDAPGAGTGVLQGTGGTRINDEGDIGGIYVTAPNIAHGFVRVAATGTITQFDATSAGTGLNQGTFVSGIDANGDISGVVSDSNVAQHGFLRSAATGSITVFDVPAAPTNVKHRGTSPLAINASGVITGMYETVDTVRHGFVRGTDGTITTFDAPGAGTGLTQGTIPFSINAGGDIAGFYVDSNHLSHGFIRTAATGAFIAPIDAPGATTTSGGGKGFNVTGTIADGIDTAGDVSGIYSDSNNVNHGYVRAAGGTITTFDVTGAGTTGLFPGTLPTSMNAAGDVAGAYEDANGVNHAFLRLAATGAITAPLDAPGAGTSGMVPGTAPFGINASDELAGTYTDSSGMFHAFLLSASGTAATPTFNPPAGSYSSTQMVAISDATAGASIYYTVDGSTPSPGSGTTLLYNGPIAVASTETINAIATANGCSNSAVATAAYTIQPAAATPSFSPVAGTYTSAQTVAISDATTNATIYYTTNGQTPTPGGASTVQYSSPITVGSTETIEAVATATGFSNSAVASAAYVINLPAPDFQVAVNPTSLTIAAGQSGKATFTVTPVNGFNSQVTFACSGLPSESSCSFSPASVTPSGTNAASSTLTVTTTAKSAALRPLGRSSRRPVYAFVFPVLATLLGLSFSGKRRRRPLQILGALLLVIAASTLTSCNSGSSTTGNAGTPLGTSMVSVSASANGGTAHSATLTITITQ